MSQKKISQAFVKKLFKYEKLTGDFIRLIRRGKEKAGVIAGCINKETGYRHIGINNVSYKTSRLAFLYVEGYMPEHDVDHKNRIRHDDRWENIRHSTRQCNIRNQGMLCTNTSGIKGVYFDKSRGKWVACIEVDGVKIYLGSFKNKDNAIIARWLAEKKFDFPSCISSSSSYLYLKKKGLLPKKNDDICTFIDRAKAKLTNNTSGIPGVVLKKESGNWVAQIGYKKKRIYIGTFKNKIDAAVARSRAEIKYNFPGCKTKSIAYLYIKERGRV